ncbi:MAG: hypothetical protein JWO64_1982 [Hyphomicrobiales bacterium]|jgi:hypothetical protein|nr:hypothetical protein [Hyphomicrobiales bacterium]
MTEKSSVTDLSQEEQRFLCHVADDGVLLSRSREDKLILGLIERGFLTSSPGANPSSEILELTANGHATVTLIRDSRS